ncbi:hypothetical protein Pedsa_0942 [Pseudopedobacter saltans DSM 12145]|uniref:Uncharacterized protein n=2 Tax=Pseudopedobacter saltans TaxID=151895 RepID=F0SAD7_PSESL|nr:hypothetical protein Pedsa_0942 [Pseudopedobacter saltans DSM 12145]
MQTELHAVETLLQRGVKVKARAPLLFRLFGKKTIVFKLGQPKAGTLHRVASYYLRTGIDQTKLHEITSEEALTVISVHGKNIYKAVATAILNGYWSGMLFTKPFAWWLSWHLTPKAILTLMDILITYGGIQDFMTTTRLVRSMKLTAPNLGQKTKGS